MTVHNVVFAGPTRTSTTRLWGGVQESAYFSTTKTKETYFFEHRKETMRSKKYELLFRNPQAKVLLDFSPTYFHNTISLNNLFEFMPQTRVVIIVREVKDLVRSGLLYTLRTNSKKFTSKTLSEWIVVYNKYFSYDTFLTSSVYQKRKNNIVFVRFKDIVNCPNNFLSTVLNKEFGVENKPFDFEQEAARKNAYNRRYVGEYFLRRIIPHPGKFSRKLAKMYRKIVPEIEVADSYNLLKFENDFEIKWAEYKATEEKEIFIAEDKFDTTGAILIPN